MRLTSLIAGLALSAPGVAAACGGLFCNTAQPVNQAAERILFAKDGETIHMHVQIAYQGPPTEFGWILPAPPDVDDALSSQELFRQLDQNYGPIFNTQVEFDESCGDAQNRAAPSAGGDFAEGAGGGAEDDGGVQVLSREAVGPFDRAILQAEDVGPLREWLDENGYQIPESTDEKLVPYIEAGAVFVALKLLPGNDAGDIQPLRLSFTSQLPAIPIVPTAVAAEPDMGVIVHVLGDRRAIPKNYAHVQINEAAIDWINQASNYADVVSAAADEAEGKAFVTDYAGSAEAINLRPIENLEAIRGIETVQGLFGQFNFQDADVQRVLADYFEIPEGVPPGQFWQCPDCFGEYDPNAEVDGAALAARIEDEINPAREELNELLAAQRYLTRLYTTLSAAEMDLDPVFSFNPDLGDVQQTRTAIQRIFCGPDGDQIATIIETPSGIRFALEEGQVPDAIQRQDGETVRAMDAPAARVIERMEESGQPVVIEDRTQALEARYGLDGEDDGCDCSAASGSPASAFWLLPLVVLGLRRRR